MKVLISILALFTTALTGAAAEPAPAKPASFHHVVCFKFKEDATPGQIAGIEKGFAALAGKIDTIKGLKWGTDVDVEGLSKGFTHCFIVKFDDRAGLDVYLPHPAHKEFVKGLKPLLEDVFVIDFVAK